MGPRYSNVGAAQALIRAGIKKLAIASPDTISAYADGGPALVDLGYGYGVEPLCEDPHDPSAAPGRRAPHVAVDGKSALDLFGQRFVLLGDEAWCGAARSAANALGVPLDAHVVSPERYGIGDAGASLVRPDGFVAWRTDEPADDAEAVVSSELTRILAR